MVKNKLVIIGDGETAEMAFEYLQSEYEISAFLVEKKYLKTSQVFNLPVSPLEDIETFYPKDIYKVFVAVSFVQANKLRERLFNQLRKLGYDFVSYIHPSAIIGNDVEVGSNCFILENVVLQRKVKLKDNIFIWSGSVIAHQTQIDSHGFIASGVMVSGFCKIGERVFLGVGSAIIDFVEIADDCTIGGGTLIHKNTIAGKTYVGVPGKELIKN